MKEPQSQLSSLGKENLDKIIAKARSELKLPLMYMLEHIIFDETVPPDGFPKAKLDKLQECYDIFTKYMSAYIEANDSIRTNREIICVTDNDCININDFRVMIGLTENANKEKIAKARETFKKDRLAFIESIRKEYEEKEMLAQEVSSFSHGMSEVSVPTPRLQKQCPYVAPYQWSRYNDDGSYTVACMLDVDHEGQHKEHPCARMPIGEWFIVTKGK